MILDCRVYIGHSKPRIILLSKMESIFTERFTECILMKMDNSLPSLDKITTAKESRSNATMLDK